MAPSLTADSNISAQTSQTVVSANPLIFIMAAILTLLTVYLSSLQACKMVERVSPVEALRLAEGEQSQRKIKKNTSVSWWGMAVQNVFRNWKKGLIVMLSIAAGIVLCSVKTKWMWLFPVSHSILWIHFQDYYRQYVFPPILSLAVLLVLIVIVYAAVAHAAKRIDIDRLRGEQE